jgi:fructose-bisphosphate aldolase class II
MLKSMIQGVEHKRLDMRRIAAIKKAVGIPVNLHGGSGTDNHDFRKAIQSDIAMIHISTELRVAWRRELEEALRKDSGSVAPHKPLPEMVRELKAVVMLRTSAAA